jgi:hypothetical protein
VKFHACSFSSQKPLRGPRPPFVPRFHRADLGNMVHFCTCSVAARNVSPAKIQRPPLYVGIAESKIMHGYTGACIDLSSRRHASPNGSSGSVVHFRRSLRISSTERLGEKYCSVMKSSAAFAYARTASEAQSECDSTEHRGAATSPVFPTCARTIQ